VTEVVLTLHPQIPDCVGDQVIELGTSSCGPPSLRWAVFLEALVRWVGVKRESEWEVEAPQIERETFAFDQGPMWLDKRLEVGAHNHQKRGSWMETFVPGFPRAWPC
jgi:hypothetical protein